MTEPPYVPPVTPIGIITGPGMCPYVAAGEAVRYLRAIAEVIRSNPDIRNIDIAAALDNEADTLSCRAIARITETT